MDPVSALITIGYVLAAAAFIFPAFFLYTSEFGYPEKLISQPFIIFLVFGLIPFVGYASFFGLLAYRFFDRERQYLYKQIYQVKRSSRLDNLRQDLERAKETRLKELERAAGMT